jgi:hypothetical protein
MSARNIWTVTIGLALAFVLNLMAHATPLDIAGVTASAFQAPNSPDKTIDGNPGTRWAAHGDGQFIQYELAECGMVASVEIAWYKGNTRVATFNIETSPDGTTWTPAFSGDSSGTTTALETFDFDDVETCFVRIVGFGNSLPNPTNALWNAITEVVIQSPAPPTVPVPLSALEIVCQPLLMQQEQ